MPVDLSKPPAVEGSWARPAVYWPALTDATAHLETPLAAIGLAALRHNVHDLRRRAAGMPIRVASKSVRSRTILDAVVAMDGYAGILAFTLPEALWLAAGDDEHLPHDDVVVAYPTADRTAIARLASSPELAARVTLMVDSPTQLDLVDSVAAPATRPSLRVCLDLDASWPKRFASHLKMPRRRMREAKSPAGPLLEAAPCEP